MRGPYANFAEAAGPRLASITTPRRCPLGQWERQLCGTAVLMCRVPVALPYATGDEERARPDRQKEGQSSLANGRTGGWFAPDTDLKRKKTTPFFLPFGAA